MIQNFLKSLVAFIEYYIGRLNINSMKGLYAGLGESSLRECKQFQQWDYYDHGNLVFLIF